MTSIAEIHEILDRTARRDEEWRAEYKAILAENARRDEERKAEAARRDAEYKAAAARRDAEYKAEREKRDAEREKRDAEYNAAMERERKKTDKAIRKSMGHFDTQWGRFIEALVNNQIVTLFQARDIPVTRTLERESGRFGNRRFEFDIIAKNGYAIIVIEVKTTLRPDDVKEFLGELSHFKEWLPEYSHLTVYGAVAYLREDSKASQYAEQQGLFVIRATGKSAKITNPEEFAPKKW